MSGLASPKSVGQLGRLETQARVNAAVLRQNFFSFEKPQFLPLKALSWVRPIRIIEDNFLNLKSSSCRCKYMYKIPS